MISRPMLTTENSQVNYTFDPQVKVQGIGHATISSANDESSILSGYEKNTREGSVKANRDKSHPRKAFSTKIALPIHI